MPSLRSCLSLALLLAAAPLTGCSQAYFWSINPGSRDSRGETMRRAPPLLPRDLAGVIGLAGPYDFLPMVDPKIKACLARKRIGRGRSR